MTVNLDERYFQGGVKTKAGKVRIVPIHHNILPFVKSRSAPDVLGVTPSKFRKLMYKRLEELGIANTDDGKKHTPHDCRHTFSALCEHYGVNENDRKRMLGHAFKDVTNAVYGHRGIDDLRKEIEKIQVPKNWCC
jgi:integrase